MANILEFLRGLTTDPEAQRVFRVDPEGFVTRAGFADLTGEDVVEGLAVVRRSLPADVAAALADFDDDRRIPSMRPTLGERDLDPALRLLTHAVDLVTGDGSRPIAAEADAAIADPEPAAEPRVEAPAHPPTPEHHEPIRAEAELVPAPVEPDVALAAEPTVDAAPAPSPAPTDERLSAVLADAARQAGSVLDDYVQQVQARLAAVVEEAERDAARLREEAQADREAARAALRDAEQEAQRIRAEVQAGHDELAARRAELRQVERELRERISGLDDVFRTVLKDD